MGGKQGRAARVVLLEDEEDDSSKQGKIDEDPNTYFHQDDEVVDDVVHDTAVYDSDAISSSIFDKRTGNVKTEYKKLFDSIKKTRAQTQGENNELFENVKQKTYAYADVRAQNQDLLLKISELKAKLKTVEN
ncbi:hypothetical protein Tco_1012971, partial [Tanacetum coccineum]